MAFHMGDNHIGDFLPMQESPAAAQAGRALAPRQISPQRHHRIGKIVMVQATDTTMKMMAGSQDILNMVGWSYPP